jgi:hypothetical protein
VDRSTSREDLDLAAVVRLMGVIGGVEVTVTREGGRAAPPLLRIEHGNDA